MYHVESMATPKQPYVKTEAVNVKEMINLKKFYMSNISKCVSKLDIFPFEGKVDEKKRKPAYARGL